MRLRPLVTVLLLTAGLARAHPGLPEARALTKRPGTGEVYATATFGALLSRDDGASWGWVCGEALPTRAFLLRRPVWTPAGTLAVATAGGLLVSRDAGCSWEMADPAGLGTGGLVDLAPVAGEPDGLWLVRDDAAALYRTTDGGRTVSVREVRAALRVTGARSAGPARVWASARERQTDVPVLLLGEGDGALVERPVALDGVALNDFALLGVVPGASAAQDTLWARLHGRTTGLDYLVRSRDGGATWEGVRTAQGTAVQGGEIYEAVATSDDGRHVWASTVSVMYRSDDGGGTFTLLPQPQGNACVHAEGGRLWACGETFEGGWAVGRAPVDATSFTPLLYLGTITGALSCPAGTPVAQTCPARWPAERARMLDLTDPVDPEPPGETPAPPAEPPEKGGCAARPGAPAAAALLLLARALRRRRP